MYHVEDKDFVSFVEGEFAVGQEIEEATTERDFINVLCVHFYLDDEKRQTLKDSHEAIIRQLLRLFPVVTRSDRPSSMGRTKTLQFLRVLDYRWRKGGEHDARWGDLDRFIAERCKIDARAFAAVSDLRDAYNSFKQEKLDIASIGLCKKLMGKFPALRRSVHRIKGLNSRCLEGIDLIEAKHA